MASHPCFRRSIGGGMGLRAMLGLKTEKAGKNGELLFDYTYRPEVRDWAGTRAGSRILEIIESTVPAQRKLLREFAGYAHSYERIERTGSPDGSEPYFQNRWFPGLDAITLYCLLVARNPQRYVEIGSGNSTKFARRAIRDFGLRTKIVSIDPEPRAGIDNLCDEIIRKRCEDVDQSVFFELGGDDLLFVDNSHRSFQGSDVTVFFTEILPVLDKALAFGIHDIFLPRDYPVDWIPRFYNEQYLLMAYLFGGAEGRKVLLANAYLSEAGIADEDLGHQAGPLRDIPLIGGAFWLNGVGPGATGPA